MGLGRAGRDPLFPATSSERPLPASTSRSAATPSLRVVRCIHTLWCPRAWRKGDLSVVHGAKSWVPLGLFTWPVLNARKIRLSLGRCLPANKGAGRFSASKVCICAKALGDPSHMTQLGGGRGLEAVAVARGPSGHRCTPCPCPTPTIVRLWTGTGTALQMVQPPRRAAFRCHH